MQTYESFAVSAPARLHCGLLDCGNTTDQFGGGFGIALSGPRTEVVVANSASGNWEIVHEPPADSDQPAVEISGRTYDDLRGLTRRAEDVGTAACSLTIKASAPEHMGLGSKTSLLMAASWAIASFSLDTPEQRASPSLVTRLTRRGGMSGIGINTFWHGGIIWDSGHDIPRGERTFLPSSAHYPDELPLINARLELMPSYRASLFYDLNNPRIDNAREVEIFQQHMPFPDEENRSAIAAAYHGALPALKRHDMKGLARALQELHSAGLKAKELDLQSDNTRAWLETCWGEELPSGLSSFGPIVYVIGREGSRQLNDAASLAQTHSLEHFGTYAINYNGAFAVKQWSKDSIDHMAGTT